jgi:hypothetical protein
MLAEAKNPADLGRVLINASGRSGDVRFRGIVLQNSFLGCVQNFAGALVRSLENYVGGHMINPIFNRQPS